ncbi:MAG: transposase [Vicinamibacterales bacterium]|nr:transposase [Vicinamibacterales bacterium]MDP7472975.1 transposase [Vicinamibacterales bacterium]MDP7672342.1 transposase [Vicinamibacterales bacterium]HJO39999.1 transposase [Vicinamibacterales bacterium]
MPRQRYTPEQIITKLRLAEVELARGQTMAEVCRKLGTSEQTYSRWRKEYGGLRGNHLKRLKALELDNRRLRTVSADQALALVVVKETADRAGSWEGKSDPISLIINGPPMGAGQSGNNVQGASRACRDGVLPR